MKILRPNGALKFLWNLDGVIDSSDSESVSIFADEVETQLDSLLLEGICLWETACENEIRLLSIVWAIEGPAISKASFNKIITCF